MCLITAAPALPLERGHPSGHSCHDSDLAPQAVSQSWNHNGTPPARASTNASGTHETGHGDGDRESHLGAPPCAGRADPARPSHRHLHGMEILHDAGLDPAQRRSGPTWRVSSPPRPRPFWSWTSACGYGVQPSNIRAPQGGTSKDTDALTQRTSSLCPKARASDPSDTSESRTNRGIRRPPARLLAGSAPSWMDRSLNETVPCWFSPHIQPASPALHERACQGFLMRGLFPVLTAVSSVVAAFFRPGRAA